MTTSTAPQTVSFELTVFYHHIDRNGETVVTREVESFEGMFDIWRKESCRRKNADKATGAIYRVVLTDHGRQVCSQDVACKESHDKMLNKNFLIGGHVPSGIKIHSGDAVLC